MFNMIVCLLVAVLIQNLNTALNFHWLGMKKNVDSMLGSACLLRDQKMSLTLHQGSNWRDYSLPGR